MDACRARSVWDRIVLRGMSTRWFVQLIASQPKVMMARSTEPGRISMSRKFPPFVESWRYRLGKIRVYFRQKKGPRIPLPASVGSDDFNAEYQAALSRQLAKMRERRRPDKPDTIAPLVTTYMRSATYLALRQTTKAGYVS